MRFLFVLVVIALRGIDGKITNQNVSQSDEILSANHSKISRDILLKNFIDAYPVEDWKSLGIFDDSYFDSIDEHWLKFPPRDTATQYFLGFVYIFIMIMGCSGNMLVLFMYFKCRSLRTPGNMLIANLALSDFLMIAKTPVFIINSFYQGPAMGVYGCTIYGFIGGLSGNTDISTLTAIAYDRYSVVVRPLEPLKNLNNLRAKILVICCWLYALSFAIVPLLNVGISNYVPEGFLTSCSFNYLSDAIQDKVFIVVFFIGGWLLPFTVISYCYLRIMKVVIRNRRPKKSGNFPAKHYEEETVRKGEIKLAGLVIVVIVLFFISWTPYGIVTLLAAFNRKDIITPVTSILPALLCKMASCLNPFVYIISHPKFRNEFGKLIFKNKKIAESRSFRAPAEFSKEMKPEVDGVEIIDIDNIPQGEDSEVSSVYHQKVLAKQESFQKDSFDQPPSWYKSPFPKQSALKRAYSNN